MLDKAKSVILNWGAGLIAQQWGRIGFLLAVGSPAIMFVSLSNGISALVFGLILMAAARSIDAKLDGNASDNARNREPGSRS
jgi:hypothetical protein